MNCIIYTFFPSQNTTKFLPSGVHYWHGFHSRYEVDSSWNHLLLFTSVFTVLFYQLGSYFAKSDGLTTVTAMSQYSLLCTQSSIPEQCPVRPIYNFILQKMLTTEQEEAEASYNIFNLWERVGSNSRDNCLYAMLQQRLTRIFLLQAIWWW